MNTTQWMCAPVISSLFLLAACGGEPAEGNGSGASGQSSDQLTYSSGSNSLRIQTVDDLRRQLPEVDASVSTATPEGLWLITTSTMALATRSSTDLDSEFYYHGRQWAIMKAVDGGYSLSVCSVDTDVSFEDVVLNATSSKLSFQETTNYGSDETNIVWGLGLTDNRAFSGQLSHTYDQNWPVMTEASYTNMAGVKISNAMTFIEAASEFDISFDLTINGLTSSESEIGDQISCIGFSEGEAQGSVAGGELKDMTAAYIGASSFEGETLSFSTAEGRVGDAEYITYAFQQTLTDNIGGKPLAEGSCSNCIKYRAAEMDIDDDAAVTEMKLYAHGEDEDGDTLTWTVQLSPL